MTIPTYHAGQTVRIYSPGNTLLHGKECFIHHPCLGGDYFVHTLTDGKPDGGYAYLPESELRGSVYLSPGIDHQCTRVVFFGNGEFALPTLRWLWHSGYDIRAVVTAPDKPKGRGHKTIANPVKRFALSNGIDVLQPNDLKDPEFLGMFRGYRPHVSVIVEFRIVPEVVINVPQWGMLNLHSSLLPQYRGASTISAAIRNGECQTGVTTFLLDAGIDTGNIVNNLAVPIGENDTAGDIFVKLADCGSQMVASALDLISNGYRGVEQKEFVNTFHLPSYAPKISREDCEVRWNKPMAEVHDFIRAYTPKPGAWTKVWFCANNEEVVVKIHKTRKTFLPRDLKAPGEWIARDGRIYICCADRLLEILELQLPGKAKVTAKDFYNGFRKLPVGFCRLRY